MTSVRRDGNGQIQRANNGSNGTGGGNNNLAAFLANDLGPQIRMALPKHLDGDRMARVALTALRTTPKLAECDRYSFAACILQSAQLGLEVNTPLGHAYLIPRKGQCTLQIGYQGMIELARRSGQVASIYAYTVHAGDEFRYELGLDLKLSHIPNPDAEQSERSMTFVYAVAALRGGDRRPRALHVAPEVARDGARRRGRRCRGDGLDAQRARPRGGQRARRDGAPRASRGRRARVA